MSRKKSDKQFKQEVFDLVGDEYSFLENYKKAVTKIKVRHNVCGNIYYVRPNDFLNGNRCPYCNGKIKKTNEQFKEEVYSLVGKQYTILGNYKNNKTKIKMKHNICGREYDVTPAKFLTGNRCPYCAGLKKKTLEEFKKEVYDLVGDEYSVLNEYRGNHIKIKIKHNKCGNEYYVRPSNFLNGNKCPLCLEMPLRKTDKQFKKEVFDLVGDEYTLLEEYKLKTEL